MINQLIFVVYASINLLIAVVLYFKQKQNFVSQFYVILVVYLIAFIGISSFVEISSVQNIESLFSTFLIFIYSMFPSIFLHFIICFTSAKNTIKSALTISVIYFIGMFSFLLILFGFLPNSFDTVQGLQTSSTIFYLTWMSILFAIGITQLYKAFSNNRKNKLETKLLFSGFVFLMLILPGPFSETIFSTIITDYSIFYYVTSTIALIIAVYILFKQKSSTQILNALKLSLNFLSDVLLLTDKSFNIEIAEGDIEKLLNLNHEEIIDKNLNELILDAGYLDDYKNLSLKKKLSRGVFDVKYTDTDGRVAFLNFSIAPIIDNDIITGYILIGRDISDRKNLEEELIDMNESLEQNVRMQTSELAEMNRRLHLDIEQRKFTEDKLRKITSQLKETILSKDKMFSIVAHDLRSPFVSLLGMSELLEQEIDDLDKDEAKRFSQNLHISAKRVYHLLENLLQWAKIQTDRIQFEREKVDLNKVVSNIVFLFESNAIVKKIELIDNIEDNTFIFTDINMLETIIRNLTSNAIKFTKVGGTVIIKSKKLDYFTEIYVEDSGVGIPKENISRVFAIDNFVSTPDTENRKGSGLGLILTKEFVEKNGGELTVESEVGKGTTIKFTVPNVVEESD